MLVARPGPPLERPGSRDIRLAAKAAWEAVGGERAGRRGWQAQRLVRRMKWVETGGSRSSLVRFERGGEVRASDGNVGDRNNRGFLEFTPPASTEGGAPFAPADVMRALRQESSAVDWAAGAGPPHGCNVDGCELEYYGEPFGWNGDEVEED